MGFERICHLEPNDFCQSPELGSCGGVGRFNYIRPISGGEDGRVLEVLYSQEVGVDTLESLRVLGKIGDGEGEHGVGSCLASGEVGRRLILQLHERR